jgi:hypothetical protein
MGLPFTPDEFFAVFAEYNRAFWPIAVALWLTTAAILALVWRNPARYSRTMSLWLAALWLWNAIAYHAFLFTHINPAAWLFAGLFGVEGLLLLWAGLRTEVEYFSSLRAVGGGLAIYALVYPILTVGVTHGYPAAPTFGVPCPTAILTIALLLTTRGGVPIVLAIIPALWGFVGGSAAFILDVPTDYVLFVAGALLTIKGVTRMRLLRRALH